ncbi:LysE family translocator [Thioclava sp. GXIMD4215]|uniref:LysE family translocator n=1 Tax=Thioclava sp. GXIMD4215 TaxID=3131928 RepID=UPI0032532848
MSHLLLAYIAYFLAVASPGPSTLAIMGAAMGSGRRTALALAAGVVSGSLVWAGLTALGVGALLMGAARLLWGLKILGGLYLLYLAWKTLRAAGGQGAVASLRPQSSGQAYRRGLLLHLTNPKAILGWAAIFTLGVPEGAGAGDMALLFAGCAGLGGCVNFGYALGFSASLVVARYQRARCWIEGAMAAVFAAAGLRLLFLR